MNEFILTDDEADLLDHALRGRTEHVYRNHYCASIGSSAATAWDGLCTRGLAVLRRASDVCRDYAATDAGRAALLAARPPAPAWRVSHREMEGEQIMHAPTRGAARMRAAVFVDDATNCGIGVALVNLVVRRARGTP